MTSSLLLLDKKRKVLSELFHFRIWFLFFLFQFLFLQHLVVQFCQKTDGEAEGAHYEEKKPHSLFARMKHEEMTLMCRSVMPQEIAVPVKA